MPSSKLLRKDPSADVNKEQLNWADQKLEKDHRKQTISRVITMKTYNVEE